MALRILNIVGARPNFMKIAPLIEAMRADAQFQPRLIHTGQHYDDNMTKVFFEELGIPRPDVNLGVGGRGSRDEQISCIMERFEPLLVAEQPALVLVVGDVNSTVACARVAKRHGVRIAHVEAGLRSFDQSMPEEHNRIETDRLSDYLFVTEESGMKNLADEGVGGKRFFVGNVMIDTLVRNLFKVRGSSILSRLSLIERSFLVGTFHRPSNVDSIDSLSHLVRAIVEVSRILPIIIPLHPRTKSSLIAHGLMERWEQEGGIRLVEPLGYLDFMRLVSCAQAVITDSGGIQEETTCLGIPCLTMRENTERPVTVDLGTNMLVGSDTKRLIAEVERIVSGNPKQGSCPLFWDGKTAERIVACLKNELC